MAYWSLGGAEVPNICVLTARGAVAQELRYAAVCLLGVAIATVGGGPIPRSTVRKRYGGKALKCCAAAARACHRVSSAGSARLRRARSGSTERRGPALPCPGPPGCQNRDVRDPACKNPWKGCHPELCCVRSSPHRSLPAAPATVGKPRERELTREERRSPSCLQQPLRSQGTEEMATLPYPYPPACCKRSVLGNETKRETPLCRERHLAWI
ncbi:uncharacterized protein LOC136006206 [Lathamus discolor]|uniref:uncharacterized protein LOC136006206 n=1 Tax=Lathamus discolor TaxID=678569 RepID=UPI0032B7EA98